MHELSAQLVHGGLSGQLVRHGRHARSELGRCAQRELSAQLGQQQHGGLVYAQHSCLFDRDRTGNNRKFNKFFGFHSSSSLNG